MRNKKMEKPAWSDETFVENFEKPLFEPAKFICN
jgi:hypothetical protein